ncbi:hypothetical protein Tco_1345907, partial [Tanacetum coccineum]
LRLKEEVDKEIKGGKYINELPAKEPTLSNKEGPLKIAGLKDASQGDKDDARPIAARAMCLLRSEMSPKERFGKTKDGEICDLYALGDMITFVSTPMDTTDWGPHVETTWSVCQELLIAGLLATYLNDCGVVEDPREACLPASAVQVLVFLLTFSTHERSDSSKRLKLQRIYFSIDGDSEEVDGPSTYKLVENDQNLDVEGVNDESHFYDSDWLMRDKEIDASRNSDDHRTPIPPMPWIHVNSCKLDPSSESSCLPPPLPALNMPEMKDKYYGDFVRLGSYISNTSSSPDLQPMGQPPTFIKDWMNMTDEAMDASGNSDDQRTPTPPPVPWIHVNYNKPDPQVCDDTNEKSSSDDQSYDTKRKRKSYRLRLRYKHRVTSSIRVVRHARAPAPTLAAPAQAPAPAPASTPPPASIFRCMFKKQNKDKLTHPDTAAPTPPPPP